MLSRHDKNVEHGRMREMLTGNCGDPSLNSLSESYQVGLLIIYSKNFINFSMCCLGQDCVLCAIM